jgi:hypothetical protein
VKNIPKRKRQRAAPKGSSITANNPPSRNCADAPKTVSDPNHVAKSADALRKSGRLLPASMKSPDVFTRRDAHTPIRIVIIRYPIIKTRSNDYSVFLN